MGLFRKILAYHCLLFFCLSIFAKDTKSPEAIKKSNTKTPVKASPKTKTASSKIPVKKIPTSKPTAVKPKPPTPTKTTKPQVKKASPVKTQPKKATTKPTAAKSKPAVKKVQTPAKTPAKTAPQKKVTKSIPIKSVKKTPYSSDRLVILDAGHGGYDLGCRLSSCNEKSLALSTTLMIKKCLTDMGYRVILTRSRDIFLSLKKRTTIANETKSKLFVSIHYNAAKNCEAKGIEVFYYKSKDKWRSLASRKLAIRVLSKLVDRTGAKNRGVKTGNFHVIRETKMPAILVEGGFITHEEERNRLKDPAYRQKIARGIAEGIDSYFNL